MCNGATHEIHRREIEGTGPKNQTGKTKKERKEMKKYHWLLSFILLVGISCGDSNDIPIPIVISIPVEWQPPQTPGLHLILDQANKREYFSALRVPDGLLLGQYGSHEGGPDIQFFDGTLKSEQNFPDRESIFDLYMPNDGLPLATTELYASIYKRTADGKWELKYSRPRQQDLMFYIRRAGNALYGNWDSFDSSRGGLVKSTDNGNTWIDIARYNGKSLYGMASDDTNIYLAGKMNGYPIMTDVNGNILASRPDLEGYNYWGIAKSGNIWNMGTDNGDRGGPSHIDVFDGSILKTVYTTDRPIMQVIQIHDGKRYAVASWNWDAVGKTSLLLISSDGYNWSILVEIPCPSILNMHFADGGVYLMGGRYRDYGRVYFRLIK